MLSFGLILISKSRIQLNLKPLFQKIEPHKKTLAFRPNTRHSWHESPHLSGEKLQDIYYHWADLLFCRRVKYSVYTLSLW